MRLVAQQILHQSAIIIPVCSVAKGVFAIMRRRYLCAGLFALFIGILLATGCAGGSSPLEITVLDGERVEKPSGTEVVQRYKWWADLRVHNSTGEPVYVTLDRISYGREQDIMPAGTATVEGKTYDRPEWTAGKSTAGRPDERITVGARATLELQDVGFESHPESNRGTIRVAVEGRGVCESAPVDFLSFKSRPGQ